MREDSLPGKALEDAPVQVLAPVAASPGQYHGQYPICLRPESNGRQRYPCSRPNKKDAAYAVGQAVMKAMNSESLQLSVGCPTPKCSRCGGRHRGVDKCGAPPAGHRLRAEVDLHSKTSIASTEIRPLLPTSSQVAAISPTTCIGPVVCLLWSMRLLVRATCRSPTLTGEHLSAAVAVSDIPPTKVLYPTSAPLKPQGGRDPLWQSVSRRRSRQGSVGTADNTAAPHGSLNRKKNASHLSKRARYRLAMSS